MTLVGRPAAARAAGEPLSSARRGLLAQQATDTFTRILIAVDTSATGVHALLVGLKLASTLGASVSYVHVCATDVSDAGWMANVASELSRAPDVEISEALAALEGKVPEPPDASRFVPMGSPAEGIVDAARTWSADLVVIGSHGRDGLGRLLLGSVAEAVARQAPCPVLIVKKP